MSTELSLNERIETAATAIGKVWPLHSFVTANPLAGLEDRPFHDAVADATRLFNGNGYPDVAMFRRALATGRIDEKLLRERLAAYGYPANPEQTLEQMAATRTTADTTAPNTARVDAALTKWLTAFLDQGQATWSMPDRNQGFYAAFRQVARHDTTIPDHTSITTRPESPADAIRDCLSDLPKDQWTDIFQSHLAALPGWTGFIKQRAAEEGPWQTQYPITLMEYLAVRLILVDLFEAPLTPAEASDVEWTSVASAEQSVPLPEVWLRAWEATYRSALVDTLTEASASLADSTNESRPDAQFVFCIDTRSEIIRRHIEAAGNYDTYGYAGFFGIPMRYHAYGTDMAVDACPPILETEHHIPEHPTTASTESQSTFDRWHAAVNTSRKAIKQLRSNPATAFSFIESAGAGYGLGLLTRTVLPRRLYDLLETTNEVVPDRHTFCAPALEQTSTGEHDLPVGLTLDQKLAYAAAAFEQMGWDQFARIVVFTGHASQTANNPFDSSLDCGACAANPGGPNARVLAAICNDDAVRQRLQTRGIDIPEETLFVAGEHNTTTSEIDLYDSVIPETHRADLEQLQADLDTAQAGAARERAPRMGDSPDSGTDAVKRRAVDWAETRPEWGLAGNASFVIGPRALTAGCNLDGRAFLHAYNWRTDPDGEALRSIMTGPMVVTQWINMQYYFATVDNAVFGSGSKITQNPVGNIGVYQGNGGDLMAGLPAQSLMHTDGKPYHQPLRLSTIIHAPVDRVTTILATEESLTDLVENNWCSLTVIDPQQRHQALHYAGDGDWIPVDNHPSGPAVSPPIVADDD